MLGTVVGGPGRWRIEVGGWQRDIEELEPELEPELELELELELEEEIEGGLVESAEAVESGLDEEVGNEVVDPVIRNKPW